MRRTISILWRRGHLLALLALLLSACDVVNGPASAPTAPVPLRLPTPIAAPAPPTAPPATASDLLARALSARTIGDNDAAAEDLHTLISAHPDARDARPARFYLAESFALRRRWTSAAEGMRAFLADGAQDDLAARALFWLARCQEEAGAWDDAASSYARYQALNTPLAPYALLRAAAQRRAQGQPAPAADAFEAAAGSTIARGERAGAYEKAIALRQQLGQPTQALADYRKLLTLAESPDYRARILGEAAALAQTQGAAEDARGWLRELAEKLPASPQALDAVTQLLAEPQGGGLAPDAAARVYELHERHTDALAQYDAAISAASGEEAALELRRQRALVRRAAGDLAAALDDLAAIGAESPNSAAGRQAQLDWVQTKGQNSDTQGALDGYRAFAQSYADDPRAPEALSRAVLLLVRLGDAEGATQQRLDLARRYPASAQAHEALDEAGWALYRAGRNAEAQAAWAALGQQASGAVAARANFWAARLAREQQPDAAQKLLEAALAQSPYSYYGVRAGELLQRPAPQRAPLGTPTSADEWRAAEDWIASWSGKPAYRFDERGYPPEVLRDGAVLRALALADVGLPTEATAEWNTARANWQSDPVKLYLLARLAASRDAPYAALNVAEDLLASAPNTAPAAPAALLKLRFPTPYSALVVEQARAFKLDPRALYALLRQESLFNPQATSWVGARGLAQVMPTTAQGIAQHFGLGDFDEADLYRPVVSVRFGAYYLSNQIAAMDGSLQGGLAAYNGGPGNATRWADGSTVADPDAFAERIDYAETQSYVKLVYGYYGVYQRLYDVR